MKPIELEELTLSDLYALHSLVSEGMVDYKESMSYGYNVESLCAPAFQSDKWKAMYLDRKLQLTHIEEAICDKVSKINYK